MQTRKVLVVVAAALLFGTVGAMAQTDPGDVYTTVTRPRVALGEAYHGADLINRPEVPTNMPAEPNDDIGPMLTLAFDNTSVLTETELNTGMGSALMTPRGGAISSPKQLADREIRRLIRRLD
jgi:hypothetical protein